MTTTEVLALLSQHKEYIQKQFEVKRIGIFGSKDILYGEEKYL